MNIANSPLVSFDATSFASLRNCAPSSFLSRFGGSVISFGHEISPSSSVWLKVATEQNHKADCTEEANAILQEVFDCEPFAALILGPSKHRVSKPPRVHLALLNTPKQHPYIPPLPSRIPMP